MKKLQYYFAILAVLLIPALGKSQQYQLQPAFPNLPKFNLPIELVNAQDGSNRLFVLEQKGLIYVINNSPSVSVRKTFMNFTSKVTQGGGEAGLLSLAFHPNFENNRYFYLSYTFDSAGSGSGIWSRISRYRVSASNPDTARVDSGTVLITLPQPFTNHNGGRIAFGPDGYLYISFGDGGSAGDPNGNGQNRSVLLGKILRINVDSAGGGKAYSIPTSNPFYGNVSGYKEEIFAYGLRNVWKFSFDLPSNRLWAGDVGQNAYEEIDIVESGKNYGWNKMEGFHCYGTCDTTGKGFTRPVYDYPRTVGQSITGGYVYRGSLLPGLYGKYIYGDYILGTVFGLTYNGTVPATSVQLQDTNFNISTFGVDENNEIYACRYSSTLGEIFKIVNKSASTLSLKMAIEGLYDENLNRLNARDTVSVYLRQINSPFSLVDSAKIVIDSLSLTGVAVFNNAPNANYYLQIKSWNSLETWSKSGGVTLTKGAASSYDFTTSVSQAYGDNQTIKGTKACIYSGDIYQEGLIELSDVLNVYNDATNFVTGYKISDLNGDLTVDLEDLNIVFNNSSNFVQLIKP